jgi:carbonic anhydrase/SulP family sulfate permease
MVNARAEGQHPLAVVISCIDSWTPAELVFDLGVGDILSVRIAGSITSRKVLGSVEYGCALAGAKLIVVMAHTRCGAVTAAVELMGLAEADGQAADCQHLGYVVQEIQKSIDPREFRDVGQMQPAEREHFINAVARRSVSRTIVTMLDESRTLARLVREDRVAIIGAMYDVGTREIDFLAEASSEGIVHSGLTERRTSRRMWSQLAGENHG